MEVHTTETHCRDHTVTLSKGQIEYLLRDFILEKLATKVPHKDVQIEWGETSVDSGLRKEVQVVIRVREDLSDRPAAG